MKITQVLIIDGRAFVKTPEGAVALGYRPGEEAGELPTLSPEQVALAEEVIESPTLPRTIAEQIRRGERVPTAEEAGIARTQALAGVSPKALQSFFGKSRAEQVKELTAGTPLRYGTREPEPVLGESRQLTATEMALSIKQQLINLGLHNVVVHKRTSDIYADITAVRSMLSRTYFSKEKTEDGYEALKQYRREFDENRQRFKDTPLHDWTSHAADAFRIIPKVKNTTLIKKKPIRCKIKY